MVETLRIRCLEEELERLRSELYKSVGGEPSRLSDLRILPLSKQLDALIVEVQREKSKFSQ